MKVVRQAVHPAYPERRWVIERPFGRALADAGVGRTIVQPQGIQGNLSGVMRAGATSLRPYDHVADNPRRLQRTR